MPGRSETTIMGVNSHDSHNELHKSAEVPET